MSAKRSAGGIARQTADPRVQKVRECRIFYEPQAETCTLPTGSAMSLSGKQHEELGQALMEAFRTYEALEQMLFHPPRPPAAGDGARCPGGAPEPP